MINENNKNIVITVLESFNEVISFLVYLLASQLFLTTVFLCCNKNDKH